MSKSVLPQNSLICKGNHQLKSIFFCKRCASEIGIHNQLDRVFFCRQCNPTSLMQQHTHVADRYSVTQVTFTSVYDEFRQQVQLKNRMTFTKYIQANTPRSVTKEEIFTMMNQYLGERPSFYASALRKAEVTVAELNSMDYRKWLIRSHFWQKPYSNSIDSEIDDYVKKLFAPKVVDIWSNFELDFKESLAAAVNLGQEINGSSVKLEELRREKRISDLFVQVTSCFSNEDIERAVRESKEIEQTFPESYNFLLKLGRLKALELHDRGAEQMRAILKDIKPSTLQQPREKQLYFYYSAIAQWVRVEDPANTQGDIFLDARNKKYFRLEDANQYVQCLTKAIEINRRQVYLTARGIGYIAIAAQTKLASQAKKIFGRAEDDFSQAKDASYKSDAMDCNRLFSRLRRGLEIESFNLKEPLQERKTEYIMNICKHLEKSKKYIELRRCSEELVNRQPNNIGFKVCLLNTLLKLKDTDAARQQLSSIKSLKELSSAEIEQFQRKIERLKAYEQDKRENLSDAEGKFQHAAKIGQPSATYWYEYASFLFRHREERERNDKALVAINNSLELKAKPEYYQLKYLLLFMMGNLQEAKLIQQHIIDPKYDVMKQYVNENT